MRKIPITLFLPVLITSFSFYQSPTKRQGQCKTLYSRVSPDKIARTFQLHSHNEGNIDEDDNNYKQQFRNKISNNTRKDKKKWIPSIVYSILFLISRPVTPNSGAVIGYIPKGASGLRNEQQKNTNDDRLPPNTIPREILEKDYGGNERKRELEMKLYMEPTQKKKVEVEEEQSSGGLRPGGGGGGGSEEGVSETATQSYEEQLRLIPEIKPQQQQEHKLQAVQRGKPASSVTSIKTKRKNKVIALAQFSAFGAVGVVWAKYQNEAEQKRVNKGIELYKSNKAEFFNITGTAESDASLQKAIEDMKNATSTDDDDEDDDDDDEDDDEDDEPRVTGKVKPKPKGPKPSGGMPPPPPPKSTSTSDNGDDKVSDDDIERVRRMFEKK